MFLMKVKYFKYSFLVRTPLNAIINYLEIALESNLNEAAKEAIGVALGSSKSLIYIINDLLVLIIEI